MSIYKLDRFTPEIGNNCYFAPDSKVIGNTIIGDDVSIWFNSIVRGDVDQIKIGDKTNIQDFSMLHVSSGFPLTIGKEVTVGHRVTLHGCVVGDNCLIGMGATIMDGAFIGENSLVAAGSLVPPGKTYPPRSFIRGVPGRRERDLTLKESQIFGNHYKSYLENKKLYLTSNSFIKV
ncbi:MAG: gamma carbonic anhydrase family protein [Halobacteriovoraceae bacterium]|nr:gamma carbonic anhydrase family protein [Halobacteriovoraceae bacterium]